MEAKIIFSNGKEIQAEQNGTCYILAKKPEFPTNLRNIKIENEEGTSVITNGEIVEVAKVLGDKNYWFTILEIPAARIKEQVTDQRLADIEDALCEITKE